MDRWMSEQTAAWAGWRAEWMDVQRERWTIKWGNGQTGRQLSMATAGQAFQKMDGWRPLIVPDPLDWHCFLEAVFFLSSIFYRVFQFNPAAKVTC